MAESSTPDDSLIRSGDGRVTPPAPVLSAAVATTSTSVAPAPASGGGTIRIPRNITRNLADLKSEFDEQERTLPPARPAKVGARPKGRPRKDPQPPAPESAASIRQAERSLGMQPGQLRSTLEAFERVPESAQPPSVVYRIASPVVEEAPLRTPELPDAAAPTAPLPTAETDEEESSSDESSSSEARPSPPGYGGGEGEGLSFLTKLMLGLAAGSAAFLAYNAYVAADDLHAVKDARHAHEQAVLRATRLAKAQANLAANAVGGKSRPPVIEPIDPAGPDGNARASTL